MKEEYTEEQLELILSIYGTLENYYVSEAKIYLNETDYVCSKITEYQITGKDIPDYSEIFKKREEAREIIREYEKK